VFKKSLEFNILAKRDRNLAHKEQVGNAELNPALAN
jgi:hypothetical protein